MEQGILANLQFIMARGSISLGQVCSEHAFPAGAQLIELQPLLGWIQEQGVSGRDERLRWEAAILEGVGSMRHWGGPDP